MNNKNNLEEAKKLNQKSAQKNVSQQPAKSKPEMQSSVGGVASAFNSMTSADYTLQQTRQQNAQSAQKASSQTDSGNDMDPMKKTREQNEKSRKNDSDQGSSN